MILLRGVTLRFQGLADETLGLAMRFRKASPHIRGLPDQCAPGPQHLAAVAGPPKLQPPLYLERARKVCVLAECTVCNPCGEVLPTA